MTEPLHGYSVLLCRLREEDGGGWLAKVPDLPGCFSDGETPEGALANVYDAIEAWLEVATERRLAIPKARCYGEDEEYDS